MTALRVFSPPCAMCSWWGEVHCVFHCKFILFLVAFLEMSSLVSSFSVIFKQQHMLSSSVWQN